MQQRSGAERRAIWTCLNVAIWRRERSDRAIQQIQQNSTAFLSIPAIRTKGSTSALSTRKFRPIYSHPYPRHVLCFAAFIHSFNRDFDTKISCRDGVHFSFFGNHIFTRILSFYISHYSCNFIHM